ncbi:MAG: CDP-diacylglycerol--glycerol-3-phosphate 3-phosphatidyltransferase [Limisphaerales bacterium]
MTTANKITIVRILLVPFFVVHLLYYVANGNEINRLVALLAFAIAAISDGVDGYIARRYNQRSELGAILDPLADKLLLVLGLVLLSQNNAPYLDRIPLWMTVTVFSRDALIMLGLVVIHYACGRVVIQPHFIGKVATVLQMIAVFWTLLKWDQWWLDLWAIGATVCTGISGLVYTRDGIRQLNASPSSAAAPKQKE